jgi:hypothetical protein
MKLGTENRRYTVSHTLVVIWSLGGHLKFRNLRSCLIVLDTLIWLQMTEELRVSMCTHLFYPIFTVQDTIIIQGQLGSLGAIPGKYDLAVSTACGSLNCMVVDTIEHSHAYGGKGGKDAKFS